MGRASSSQANRRVRDEGSQIDIRPFSTLKAGECYASFFDGRFDRLQIEEYGARAQARQATPRSGPHHRARSRGARARRPDMDVVARDQRPWLSSARPKASARMSTRRRVLLGSGVGAHESLSPHHLDCGHARQRASPERIRVPLRSRRTGDARAGAWRPFFASAPSRSRQYRFSTRRPSSARPLKSPDARACQSANDLRTALARAASAASRFATLVTSRQPESAFTVGASFRPKVATRDPDDDRRHLCRHARPSAPYSAITSVRGC